MIEFLSKKENPNYPGVIDVTAEEVLEKKGELTLIDVRQPDEFTGELGHIPGSTLVTLDNLPSQVAELPRDKDIVFICRSGNRSGQACTLSKMDGLTRVYNMAGGMIRWNELGYETAKET